MAGFVFVGTAELRNQTTAIAPTSLADVAFQGVYRISAVFSDAGSAAASTVAVRMSNGIFDNEVPVWDPVSHSFKAAAPMGVTVGQQYNGTGVLYLRSGGAISFYTVITGTVLYNIRIVAEFIG